MRCRSERPNYPRRDGVLRRCYASQTGTYLKRGIRCHRCSRRGLCSTSRTRCTDLDAAIPELARVLPPGRRLVLVDEEFQRVSAPALAQRMREVPTEPVTLPAATLQPWTRS
jgi:hypothetical protein